MVWRKRLPNSAITPFSFRQKQPFIVSGATASMMDFGTDRLLSTALPAEKLQDMRSSQEKAQMAILYHATQGRILTKKVRDNAVLATGLVWWRSGTMLADGSRILSAFHVARRREPHPVVRVPQGHRSREWHRREGRYGGSERSHPHHQPRHFSSQHLCRRSPQPRGKLHVGFAIPSFFSQNKICQYTTVRKKRNAKSVAKPR